MVRTARLARSGRIAIAQARPRLPRTLTSTARTLDPSQASTSNTPHASDQSTSQHTSKTLPSASMLLLLDSIPHIPQYGFTKQAYFASSSSSDPARSIRTIETLFPGPDSHFETQLFTAWSNLCDISVVHSMPIATLLQLVRDGQDPDTPAARPVRMTPLSPSESKTALHNVTTLLESRLQHFHSIRTHLLPALTSLSTLSPTTSSLHSAFPHQTLLPNLPTPLPLLTLTSAFVDQALTHPAAQAMTGWSDPDGPDWYAVRVRLGAAYTVAILHAASGSGGWDETRGVLWRVVRAREDGLVNAVEGVVRGGGEWVKWGGRGWLGVLRSLGL
ncbi:hypothetical protein PHSY_002856 [Pseudozyma hubeiensis SY62]|uniref:Ubiquinone biosynthesis protein n=1 Tax=Pseudozyma hubeiensis (strain SY62) TaxID=1305764 RepID=R9P1Y1_PSEHS|nr:hypothetical protein PHSY_002856 [Pseudozyma hubeiensis SY62]GAC95281.1 hypothetical protein PHSY_002856 [Pseudozyma hubeiensis SY62]